VIEGRVFGTGSEAGLDRPATRAFVISLPGSDDRRQRFSERADGTSIQWEYFDAHGGASPDLVYDPGQAILHKGRTLSDGEIGCYSSHFALWKQLLDDRADQYLVLEDDVVVDWKRLEVLAQCDLRAEGIEYLRLYYKRPVPFLLLRDDFLFKSLRLVQLLGKSDGSQGYFITRAAAEKLVRASRNVVRPLDDQLDRFWDHGVRNLAIFPFPLFEQAGPSLIGFERFSRPIPSKRPRRPLASRARDRFRAVGAVWQARFKHWLQKRRSRRKKGSGA
jgi:glycosyl transferase family 25